MYLAKSYLPNLLNFEVCNFKSLSKIAQWLRFIYNEPIKHRPMTKILNIRSLLKFHNKWLWLISIFMRHGFPRFLKNSTEWVSTLIQVEEMLDFLWFFTKTFGRRPRTIFDKIIGLKGRREISRDRSRSVLPPYKETLK